MKFSHSAAHLCLSSQMHKIADKNANNIDHDCFALIKQSVLNLEFANMSLSEKLFRD